MTRLGIVMMTTAALAVLGTSAAATPALYHSPGNTGLDPATIDPTKPPDIVSRSSFQEVYLWIDPGGIPHTTGTICDNGDGDDTCGLHFKLCLAPGISFIGFADATGGVVEQSSSPPCKDEGPGTQINIAILTTASPLPSEPSQIGTLQVDTSAVDDGLVTLEMLQAVDADLELKDGIPTTLVPEPGLIGMLLPGIALLLFLKRRRAC